MKYEKLFRQYLKDLSVASAAPGGGSAGSLIFCLGVSLLQMAFNFSQPKSKHDLSDFTTRLEKTKAKISVYIDKDGDIFTAAMKARGVQRKVYGRELEKIAFDLGSNCIRILMVAQSLEPFIQRNIISDFYLGGESIKLALISAIKNIEANSILFGINSRKSIGYLKSYLIKHRRWGKF